VRDSRARREDRRTLLLALSRLPGVYVPSFFEPVPDGGVRPLVPGRDHVEKALVADLAAAPFPTNRPVSFGQAVHDRLSVEIARGCTRGCRFCHAGMIYRPVRERSLETIAALVDEGLAATGFEELSFLSLSTGDFSALESLFCQSAAKCRREQVSISLPSLRAGTLSDAMSAIMAGIRRTGATLAPEAATQRLRDVINKGISEQAVLSHAGRLFARGWQQVKLYFMIGLPTETRADIQGIFDLCRKVLDTAPPHVKRLQVTAAVSPFVPKPHTPFQWERQDSQEETAEKLAFLRSLFSTDRKLAMRGHEPAMSRLEGVLSRGDRRLAPAVLRAYGPARFSATGWTTSSPPNGTTSSPPRASTPTPIWPPGTRTPPCPGTTCAPASPPPTSDSNAAAPARGESPRTAASATVPDAGSATWTAAAPPSPHRPTWTSGPGPTATARNPRASRSPSRPSPRT
jgi:radical SAM superfamily enzyme YgiQ (UPF0313 family)